METATQRGKTISAIKKQPRKNAPDFRQELFWWKIINELLKSFRSRIVSHAIEKNKPGRLDRAPAAYIIFFVFYPRGAHGSARPRPIFKLSGRQVTALLL